MSLLNNFNLNLFKYFYYVVIYKGFTNASKHLNLVQSALSYNVKKLEEEMGHLLIFRNTKNFQLTENGEKLFETLKNVFSILESNVETFNAKNSYIDELTIGIRHYISDFIFEDIIEDFLGKNNVHIKFDLYSCVDEQKFYNDYDIVIDLEEYITKLNAPFKKNLCEIKNILVSGNELYKEFVNIKDFKELDNACLIALNPSKKNGKFQKICFEKNVSFREIISINESELCKTLIKKNIGLCLVNELFVKKELSTNEIKKINFINEELFSDKIALAYKHEDKSKYVEQLYKYFAENIRGEVK